MFHFFTRIKKLKKDEKNYERVLDIDEGGSLIMDIKLPKVSDAYSQFSPDNGLRINPELKNYFEESNLFVKNPLKVKIYNNELETDVVGQNIFKKVFKETFYAERHKIYKKNKFNSLSSLVCLLIGLAILSVTLALGLQNIDLGLFFSSVEILAWVFMWEAFDLFFFRRTEFTGNFLRYSKMCDAEIEFVTAH